jgi:hypothetical protein
MGTVLNKQRVFLQTHKRIPVNRAYNNGVFTRYATFKICSYRSMAGEENNFRQFQFLALPRVLATRLGEAGC